MLQDMAVDVIVIVAIIISAFIFGYIFTTILGEWRSQQHSRSDRGRQRAARQAWDRAGTAR
jgi:hypothetical protein